MMKVHRVSRYLFVLAALSAPATLLAQGFGVNEIGACSTSRAFAGTGAPCRDASVVYWNPAAATLLSGWTAQAGMSAISINGTFTQDTSGNVYKSTAPTAIVPHVFVNYRPANSKFSWGLGAYVPYGLTSQWGDSFPGRFVAQKAAIKTFYIQPNVAWQFHPKWSVGVGPIFGTSNVELVQAIDLSAQAPIPGGPTFGQLGIPANTQFATARLKGNATAFGAQVGVYGQLSPAWSFGARYMTPMNFDYKNADATFQQVNTGLVLGGTLQPPLVAGTPIDAVVAGEFAAGQPLGTQKAETKIVHPAQVQAGFGFTGYPNLLLSADYSWVGWKQFKEMQVTFSGAAPSETIINDYNHSSAIRLSAEYALPQYGGTKLRAGFSGVASAAPPETVTPLLPEQDRAYYTGGVGLPPYHGFALDLGYGRVETPGARGRVVNRTSRSQTAAQLNTGVFGLTANIFSATLHASF